MRGPVPCGHPSAHHVVPVPLIPSSLLHRARTGILMLLLVVLPLQGVVQWMVGLQGHRHMHTGAVVAPHDGVLARLAQPVRALLDHLHAAQHTRLQGPRLGWTSSRASGAELHAHGGVLHRHAADTADVVQAADALDDAGQGGGATAFLAWLPAAPVLPVLAGGERPATVHAAWRDRVVAPALAPPRG